MSRYILLLSHPDACPVCLYQTGSRERNKDEGKRGKQVVLENLVRLQRSCNS